MNCTAYSINLFMVQYGVSVPRHEHTAHRAHCTYPHPPTTTPAHRPSPNRRLLSCIYAFTRFMLLGNSLCLFVQGLDLRVYSKQIEESLRSVERQSVGDYIKESSNMAKLHTRIQVSRQIYIRTTQARKHGTPASHRAPRFNTVPRLHYQHPHAGLRWHFGNNGRHAWAVPIRPREHLG